MPTVMLLAEWYTRTGMYFVGNELVSGVLYLRGFPFDWGWRRGVLQMAAINSDKSEKWVQG